MKTRILLTGCCMMAILIFSGCHSTGTKEVPANKEVKKETVSASASKNAVSGNSASGNTSTPSQNAKTQSVKITPLVLIICTNALTISFGSASGQRDKDALINEIDRMEPEILLASIFVFLTVVAVACFIGFLISVFVGAPLETGAQKFFANCRDGKAEWGISYIFSKIPT